MCCPTCWQLVPLSIRVDLDHGIRTGRAWTADRLWQSAYTAALKALATVVCPRALAGHTAEAVRRKRRRAALARWR